VVQHALLVRVECQASRQVVGRAIVLLAVLHHPPEVVQRHHQKRHVGRLPAVNILGNPLPFLNCLVDERLPFVQVGKIQTRLDECRRKFDRFPIGLLGAGEIEGIAQRQTVVEIAGVLVRRLVAFQPGLVEERRQWPQLLRFVFSDPREQIAKIHFPAPCAQYGRPETLLD